MNIDEARQALREAASAVETLNVQTDEAKQALDRCDSLIREAEAERSKYDDLDTVIVKWRAQAVRSGEDPRQLPEALSEQKTKRATADEELTLCRATREGFVEELNGLSAQLTRARVAQVKAVERVLDARALEIAEEMLTLNTRWAELKRLLANMSLQPRRTMPDGTWFEYRLPDRASAAIRGATLLPEFGYWDAWEEDMGARWYRQFDRLLADPECPVDVVAVTPHDYETKPTRKADHSHHRHLVED